MYNFALIGAAGYIAPRHLKAIKETGNLLKCALDPYDGIGILDSFFPDADFFTEPERFDRHLDKLRRRGNEKIDYISICSPNYLHDAHIRMALRNGANAICEKPLVLNPWNLEALQEIEKETGKKIYTILQLRLHPAIQQLKKKIVEGPKGKVYDIDITYVTSRGKWYYASWKGDETKSGGIATNIGIHFFDMLSWIFDDLIENIVHVSSHDRVSGYLRFKLANVRYFLSINENLLPDEIKKKGKKTYRSLKINNEEIEFSEGFNDLHTLSYNQIFNGNGYNLDNTKPAIQIAHEIRVFQPVGFQSDSHPLAKSPQNPHPFRS